MKGVDTRSCLHLDAVSFRTSPKVIRCHAGVRFASSNRTSDVKSALFNERGATMRRLLMTFVLTASAAVALLANHPATFVMRSGERISGDLSYKGGTTYTLSGRDIESRDVAVITFVKDDPSAAELAQIPHVDNNPSELERHVFVTGDGKVMLGKLYKFSQDGEPVTFD